MGGGSLGKMNVSPVTGSTSPCLKGKSAKASAKLAASGDYVNGPFSIADAALFYVEYWATRLDHPVPERCAAHFARMKERPAVQTAMREEGIL